MSTESIDTWTRAAGMERAYGYAIKGAQGRVIDGLGSAIVGGRFPPGSLLPKEPELIAEYGVSRTSVRESLKVLAAKGLVEVRQRVGTRVRPRELWNVFDSDILAWYHSEGLDEEIMRDLVELRQILEPSAARLAAGRATAEELGRIERALVAMEEHATDGESYLRHDVEFHMAVYAASGNVLLQRFGHLVVDFLNLSFAIQQRAPLYDATGFASDAESHRVVYAAIARGQADVAAAAMLDLILTGRTALVEALERLTDR